MRTFFFILFVLIMMTLIVEVLRGGQKRNSERQPEIHSWIIPTIIAALVAQGLLSRQEAEELDSASLTEVEAYLVDHNIFDSGQGFQQWLFDQPELMGTGDSVFGGIDEV